MEYLILIGGAIVVILLLLSAMLGRYKRCRSDQVLVVTGKVGHGQSSKCIHGGATFVWPIFQEYGYLDLRPIQIDIPLKGALSLQNIRVNVPSNFTIGISTDEHVRGNAAERLLGMTAHQIAEIARGIIFGQMRAVIATMSIEEINADREKLIQNISTSVETELRKVGLRLINVNIEDVTDASGYIEALGQEAASKAINEAKVKVAEAERDGQMGQASAEKERAIYVAAAQAESKTGENSSAARIADSDSELRVRESEAWRQAETAARVAKAMAEKDSYAAQQAAELARAEVELATRRANEVVPAEVEKQRIEVMANADAAKVKIAAQAEAESIKAVALAKAAGTRAEIEAKAEGFRSLITVAGERPEVAITLLITEQLPQLVESQVRAISNLKIDKVTVWDGGGANGDGKGATANFLRGLIGALPPLHELAKQVGIELPEYLGKTSVADGDGRRTQAAPESTEPAAGCS